MEHPKDIGDRSTLAIMLGLRAQGFAVSVAFGENTRCDLVIDNGETLAREQCPTTNAACLRVEPSRNSQERYVRHAAAYEVGRVAFAIAEPGGRAGGSGSSA
jgi:PD-(D/E)XK nuclease superfamily protein